MKINLILPDQPFLGSPERNAPLGVMYLAAVLEENNYDVVISDMRADANLPVEEADVFGFSCTTPEYTSCVRIAKRIKKEYPKSHIIIGGIHPTVLENIDPIFEQVCVGEGEIAILSIINNIETKTHTRIRTEYPDVDSLPLPARHLLPSFVSMDLVERGKKSTSIIASRGCIFNCPFCCSRTFWGRKIRYRSVDKVLFEIKHLKDVYGIEQLRFHDDGFTTAKRSWMFELCDGIKSLDMKYRINARVDMVPLPVLKKLHETGCVDIGYGVESIEQNVLDKCNKGIKVSQIYKALKETKAVGMKTRIFFIAGLPGQSKNSHDKTIKFIEEVQPNIIDISTLVPYPGTQYYTNPEKFDIKLKDINFDDYIKQLGFYEHELDKDFVYEHDILTNAELKYSRAKVHEYVTKYKMDGAK